MGQSHHPPILFLVVLPLESRLNNIVKRWGLKTFGMRFTAGERIPKFSEHENWKCGKLRLLLTNLQRPVVWESSSILYRPSVQWRLWSDKMAHLSLTDDLNDFKITYNTVISCSLPRSVYNNYVLEIKIKTFLYRKRADTVKFLKNRSAMLDIDAFPFIKNFKNCDLSPTLGKISARFKMFPLFASNRLNWEETNKHFWSSFPYATTNYHICLSLTLEIHSSVCFVSTFR